MSQIEPEVIADPEVEKQKARERVADGIWRNNASGMLYERPKVNGKFTFRSLKTKNQTHAKEELHHCKSGLANTAKSPTVTVGRECLKSRIGWCLGSNVFRTEMPTRMEGQLGVHLADEWHRKSAEAKAERIIGDFSACLKPAARHGIARAEAVLRYFHRNPPVWRRPPESTVPKNVPRGTKIWSGR